MKLIVFFDGHCSLCHRAVRYILTHDKREKFLFASLDGETAKLALQIHHIGDSLVLLENYGEEQTQMYIEGRAILRIFWHLGGWHSLLGLLAFLPSFFFNWMYRFVAKRRYRWFPPAKIPDQDAFGGRLLP